MQNGCRFHRLRRNGELTKAQQIKEKIWLRKRLQQLMVFRVSHEKALTLIASSLSHPVEF